MNKLQPRFRLLALFFVALWCAIAGISVAQNEATDNTSATQATPDATPATVPADSPAAQPNNPNYTPTEEISEDLSVSFPVDI